MIVTDAYILYRFCMFGWWVLLLMANEAVTLQSERSLMDGQTLYAGFSDGKRRYTRARKLLYDSMD